ncbi:MAG: hypothetical protein HOH58_04020 [Opitutaceae bacterium]|nr:hypothetical protein [Opitutaceae bacterium]
MRPSLFERYSPVTITSVATLIAIAGSLGITYISISIIGLQQMNASTAALVAILCPAIVAPPIIYLHCKALRELADQKQELSAANEKLRNAVHQVKELSDMLPVCAWCHKVRDDQGYWEKVEAFIERNTGTVITHGACPDCIDHNLAELAARKN